MCVVKGLVFTEEGVCVCVCVVVVVLVTGLVFAEEEGCVCVCVCVCVVVVVVLVTGGLSSLQFSRSTLGLKGGPLLQSQKIGGVRWGRGRAQEVETAFQEELQLNSKDSGSLHRVSGPGVEEVSLVLSSCLITSLSFIVSCS